MQQFDAGITGFREMLDTLAASIKQEREALQLERDRLNTQRREFEEEQAVVAQVRLVNTPGCTTIAGSTRVRHRSTQSSPACTSLIGLGCSQQAWRRR